MLFQKKYLDTGEAENGAVRVEPGGREAFDVNKKAGWSIGTRGTVSWQIQVDGNKSRARLSVYLKMKNQEMKKALLG